jgi:hypothetical protein
MGLFGRVFGLTQTGRRGKILTSDRRQRLCQSFQSRRTAREPRELALQGIYKVPSVDWMDFYPGYLDEHARKDIDDCASGRPLTYSHKVVRYDKLGIRPTPASFIKYALTRIHGMKASEANHYATLGNNSSYTLPMAIKNIQKQQRGVAPRYNVGRTMITNTKRGNRMYHGQWTGPQMAYSYRNTVGKTYNKNAKQQMFTTFKPRVPINNNNSNAAVNNNGNSNVLSQYRQLERQVQQQNNKNKQILELEKTIKNLQNKMNLLKRQSSLSRTKSSASTRSQISSST